MIITCPECQKRYLVEEPSTLANGRTLQCISCQHQWFYTPPPVKRDFQSAQVDLLGLHSSSQISKRTFNHFTGLALLTFLFLTSSFYFARHTLAHTFPPLQPVYKTLGIKINSSHDVIEIRNVHPLVEKLKDADQLIITGNFFNATEVVQTLSPLQIIVKGNCEQATWFEKIWGKWTHQSTDQCTIAQWYYYPTEKRLFPGEKIIFETHAPATLKNPKAIQVKF